MSRDAFDEFRRIEKLFNHVMEGGSGLRGGPSRSISIRRTGDETRVNVQGDVSEEEIERLRRQHPDADIVVNGNKVGDSSPVEVLEEESEDTEKETGRKVDGPKIREVDEDEMDPGELALKRFEEKEEEKK